MLDPKFIRENPDLVKKAMANRGEDVDIDAFLDLDEKRRNYIAEAERLKNKRNTVSQEIARLKRDKQDASKLIEEMKEVSKTIKEYDEKLQQIEEELQSILMNIPNIPHSSVPIGESDEDNVEVRRWGEPKKFDFEPKAHWDLGEALNILDFSTRPR